MSAARSGERAPSPAASPVGDEPAEQAVGIDRDLVQVFGMHRRTLQYKLAKFPAKR